jgi:hypothetical protein
LRTVSALFETYDQVVAAVDALSDMGVPSSEITVVSPSRDPATQIREGAELGAAIGGVGGLLAGLGAFALPGLGSVLGVGWLIPLLVGAAAGGVAGSIIGALAGAGVDESDAHVYAEGVRRGGTLLLARIHDDEAANAKAILFRCGAIDSNTRRSEYAADGWDGFVVKDIWDEEIGREDLSTPSEREAGTRPAAASR